MGPGIVRKALGARRGEEGAVAVAFLYFFLLLCSYYTLRPVRDAMAANAGLGNLKWMFTATFVTMLAITPLFGALVARVRKRLLLPLVYTFFAVNLVLFFVAFHADPGAASTATVFFVWLSVFNMFVVSVFWSFMADVFKGEEAKRLFGPIAAGGSIGAIVGPLLTQWLAVPLGVAGLMLLSAALLLATIACIHWLGHWAVRRHGDAALAPTGQARIGGSVLAGFTLVLSSPYVLGICAVIGLGSITGTFMYLELQKIASATFLDTAARTTFFARVDLAVGILAFAFQSSVTTWLVRRLGLTRALATMPALALLSFLWLVVSPFLLPLAVTQVVRRAGDFGIARPCREMLFTVVDDETKYKAKNFVDTVIQRLSDTTGSWLHGLLQGQGMLLSGFAMVGAGSMLAVMALAGLLGQGFETRERRLSPAPARGP
jgi:AAA family ATP:ADP antiporter